MPADTAGWSFEVKWDGIRAIVFIDHGTVRVQSSNLLDITGRWPELQALADELAGHDAVLDGEIVAFGEDGRPSFQRLQGRVHMGARLRLVNGLLDVRRQIGVSFQGGALLTSLSVGDNVALPLLYAGVGGALLERATNAGSEMVSDLTAAPQRPRSPLRPWCR